MSAGDDDARQESAAWHRVGDRDQIAARRLRVATVDGERIALFVWRDRVFAIGDTCPHRGATLGNGELGDDGFVACPEHGWEYHVSDGCGRQSFEGRVACYAVQERADGVYVSRAPEAPESTPHAAISTATQMPQTSRAAMPPPANDTTPTSSESVWNPDQYERFRAERSQPFHDLVALVERRPLMRIADLGCGTGELTRSMHRALGARETLAIDSSETMLARSKEFAGDGLRFERLSIDDFPGDRGRFDLVFSNAALHWLEDHEAVFTRLRAALAPGGQLAVQMPANFDHASHVVAAEIAATPPFREALGGYEREPSVRAPEWYAELLHALGFARQHVRLQIYAHVLGDTSSVVEWVKGTLLTDYQKRMSNEMFVDFLACYRERLLSKLGAKRPYFYAFKRVLMWAAL